MTPAADRTCVIGAGASGIAACRALAIRGLPFDCCERGHEVGGLWRYPASGGRSCAYASLYANTSKRVMQYPCYPMPDAYPHYPHHTLVVRYLDDYVDHHDLRRHILFGSDVRTVSAAPGGGWKVELADGSATVYSSVIVASGGRHAEPLLTDLPGDFSGRQLHAIDYDGPDEFAGQVVVVLGLGATSADIACEVSDVAAETVLSVRTGHYIVPKLLMGHPIDEMSPLMKRVSAEVRRPALSLVLKLVNGDMTDYGLPAPPYKPGQGPLIASNHLLPAIAHGRIAVRPTVERGHGRTVTFTDGSTHEADAIIHCTGYRIAFPFLDEELVAAGDDAPPLYRLVVPPELPGLYFVGLVHSMMALMPVAEAQAEWVGDLVAGSARLPSREDMWATIRRERRRQDRRFYDSSGHLLVDPNEYDRLIARERRLQAVAV